MDMKSNPFEAAMKYGTDMEFGGRVKLVELVKSMDTLTLHYTVEGVRRHCTVQMCDLLRENAAGGVFRFLMDKIRTHISEGSDADK